MEITNPPRNSPDGRFRGGKKEPLGSVAQPAVDWLNEQTGPDPVFMMLHTRTAHFPFVVDPPAEGEDITTDLTFKANDLASKTSAACQTEQN